MAIEKRERPNFDVYEGPREEILAAGLIRADQIPTDRNAISTLNGRVVRSNCKVDETYLRVELLRNDELRVKVGIPTTAADARQSAERATAAESRARYLQEQAVIKQKELSRRAEIAKQGLKKFIRSEGEYRQYLASSIRELLKLRLDIEGSPTLHAYSLDTEDIEAALLSCDAIVEVLMAAKVKFDVDRHNELLGQLQREVAATTPYAREQVERLCRPNVAILEGEAA